MSCYSGISRPGPPPLLPSLYCRGTALRAVPLHLLQKYLEFHLPLVTLPLEHTTHLHHDLNSIPVGWHVCLRTWRDVLIRYEISYYLDLPVERVTDMCVYPIETSPRHSQKENASPQLPSCHIHLCLAKQARLFNRKVSIAALALAPTIAHIIPRQLAFQKRQHMPIDLLKLEEKPIVPVGRGYHDECRPGDMCREVALFGGCEEAVCFDADHEGTGWECGEDRGEGGRLGVRVGGGGRSVAVGDTASPSEVVRVHFTCNMDITVGIEPRDKLGALIAQIGLRGKDGRGRVCSRGSLGDGRVRGGLRWGLGLGLWARGTLVTFVVRDQRLVGC